jgi:hypothetical protein
MSKSLKPSPLILADSIAEELSELIRVLDNYVGREVGRYHGIPIIASTAVPEDEMWLAGGGELVRGRIGTEE